jgi:WD40 repeat protein
VRKIYKFIPVLVVLTIVAIAATACSSGTGTSQVKTSTAGISSQPVQNLTPPVIECTPPACKEGEVYNCPGGNCPGGCGTGCATVTPEFVTAAPLILCTPPACQAGEVLSCAQGDCPGGCGVNCAIPTATSQISTPQTPPAVTFTLPGEGITKDNLSHLAELGKISEGPVNELAFSPDSNMLALSTGNSAYIHDMSSLDLVANQQFTVPTNSVSFSPGGEQIAVAYGNSISLMPVDGSNPVQVDTGLGQDVKITHLAFSPDGTMIVYATDNGAVNLYNLDELAAQGSPVANPGAINSLQYSPDSSFLAAGTNDGKVIVWNTLDWSEAKRIEGLGSVKSVAFSPDATLLAIGTTNNIAVWGTDTWDQKFSVPINGDTPLSVAFSSDVAFLAAGTSGNLVRILDAATGAELAKLTAHSGAVTTLAFSGDGLFLASGSADGTVRLWGIK